MRLFEHLQSYTVVAAAVARVSAVVESAKASDNSLVKLTVSTAETYVVPTVQRAVVHVADRYPLAVDYLDNYSCLALETTETTLANASQRLAAAKQTIAAAPATAIHRAFELTELLVDRVLPPLVSDADADADKLKQQQEHDAAQALSSSLAASSSVSFHQRRDTDKASPTNKQRVQALAQVISDRLRQRVELLPSSADLLDFARARHQQLDAAVSHLDAFSLRARQSLADRLQPYLHVDSQLAAARQLLCSASDAAQQLLAAARRAEALRGARVKFVARFAAARNGVVAALDSVAAHLPAALHPLFDRFHQLVSYLLTVPDLPLDDNHAAKPTADVIAIQPSAPPATEHGLSAAVTNTDHDDEQHFSDDEHHFSDDDDE